MEIGDPVNHSRYGPGTVVKVDGRSVSIMCNGEIHSVPAEECERPKRKYTHRLDNTLVKKQPPPRKSMKGHTSSFNGESAKHTVTRAGQFNAAMRNALTARWLAFLNRPDNASKTLTQLRADFTVELFKELGI